MRLILDFLQDEQGQDLVEYTLIIAAIVVLSAVLFSFNKEAIASIWNKGAGFLRLADQKAS